jgi:hypothetical protein
MTLSLPARTEPAEAILPLVSPQATVALAGGKGANLATLARAGFAVPPGFIVTTDAYRAFFQTNGIGPRLVELANGSTGGSRSDLEAARSTGPGRRGSGGSGPKGARVSPWLCILPIARWRSTFSRSAALSLPRCALRPNPSTTRQKPLGLPAASIFGPQGTRLNPSHRRDLRTRSPQLSVLHVRFITSSHPPVTVRVLYDLGPVSKCLGAQALDSRPGACYNPT